MNGAAESPDTGAQFGSADASQPASETPIEPVPAETEPDVTDASAATGGSGSILEDLEMPSKPESSADGLTEDLRGLQDAIAQHAAAVAALEGESGVAEEGVESEATAEAVPAAEGAEPEATAEAVSGAEPDEAAAEGTSESEGESLDSIAPGTLAGETEAEDEAAISAAAVTVAVPRTTVTSWPFIGYVVVWLIAAGLGVWQFVQIPMTEAIFETDLYRVSMLAALVMLAAGPTLLIIVWFASWIGRKSVRVGSMFVSAFVKGASATLVGAIIWWGALLLVDYLRLGRLY